MKKVIVAGSRNIHNYNLVEQVLLVVMAWYDLEENDVTIISGTARGVDQLGERFAEEYGLPCIRIPAEWNVYGKSAGYRRNQEMARQGDMAIIFWDGESKGTKHMINLAKDYELKFHVFNEEGEEIV